MMLLKIRDNKIQRGGVSLVKNMIKFRKIFCNFLNYIQIIKIYFKTKSVSF